ncbi:spore wall protein 2-like [Penaeus japonicus]|uniref:spore wall protein 2-like n=1 Tax=Penaeus japonicus TaxID=27405 RepID=UPI001C715046|nr:spore wall protein 2-like [Penaeus japonicus]
MKSYPHESDLTCCVGAASPRPGFLLTRSVTFSDLTWPGGDGNALRSDVGVGEGDMVEAGDNSEDNKVDSGNVHFGGANFDNEVDDITKNDDDSATHIVGEIRDNSSYGMTVSVYGVCDVHRALRCDEAHGDFPRYDVTREEIPESMQGGREEEDAEWQDYDTFGMLAYLFREEDEDRGMEGAERRIGDGEEGESDSIERELWRRDGNGERAADSKSRTETTHERKRQEAARIENCLETEEEENVTEIKIEGEKNEDEAKKREDSEEESQHPTPQLSFHIYIHQQKSICDGEYPAEDNSPGERDPQEGDSTNDESSKCEEENHETRSEVRGNGARGRPNEASARLRQQYRLNLMGAIQSLDTLNDQIVEFIFSGTEIDDNNGGTPKHREALKSSMSLGEEVVG